MTQVTLTPAQIAAGLIRTGFRLGPSQFSFSVPGANSVWPGYTSAEPTTGYSVFNIAQSEAFRLAIRLWDELILPDFVEAADDASSRGEVRAAFTATDNDTAAYAYFGSPRSPGTAIADIWISNDYVGQSFARGTYNFEVLIHEIGHTLGLKHPFDAPALPTAFEDRRYTVMSYSEPVAGVVASFAPGGGSIRATYRYVIDATPMVVDIAAVQAIYGADPTTRSGASVYSFDQDSKFLQAIYDAGGDDTIDLSNFTRSNRIDLTPGAYSSIGEFPLEAQIAFWTAQYPGSAAFIRSALTGQDLFVHSDNLGIALSSVIENATGGSAADRIIGNAVANVLRGLGGNDVIAGGDGDDVLTGGSGDDVLTGGAGADVFVLGGSGEGADRVTDFVVTSDRFDLAGRAFTALAESGGNTLLTHAGGTVQLDGVTGLTLAQLNGTPPTPIPPPTPAPPPPPELPTAALPTTDQFILIAGTGVQASVIGTGRVVGAAGVQDITVLDAPGTISFGPSFNVGGDRVRLAGAADAWTIRRSGSSVELSDGDSRVVLPVGTVGIDLIFADGVRTLKVNDAATALVIGAQAITTSAAAVTAAAGPATAIAATNASLPAQLALIGAGPVIATGTVNVAGSATVAETVIVTAGSRVAFGPSFTAGNDTIVLPSTLSAYQLSRSGSTILFVSAGETVTMPVSVVGYTVRFADGSESRLFVDQVAGVVRLGDIVIGTTPPPVPIVNGPAGDELAGVFAAGDAIAVVMPVPVPVEAVAIGGIIA